MAVMAVGLLVLRLRCRTT